MVVDGPGADVAFLVGRVLFGGLLAFQGLNHFLEADGMTGYADAKGVPAPRLAVLGSGLLLVGGGLGIVLGIYPAVAAAMLVGFFVVVTPAMHDFWAVPGEQKQNQMINFVKNVELLGGSLVFLALSGEPWAYALNLGL